MNAVFVDTGAWIALLSADDELHEDAERAYAALRDGHVRFFSSSDVVDETATRLRYDVGLPAALAFRDAVAEAGKAGLLRIVWIDARTQAEAWALMASRPRLELSLTDCTSAVVARRNKVKRVFGFDDDFEALGFELVP